MKHVRLGDTGLTASAVGLGGGSTGRFGLQRHGRSGAVALIRQAYDAGITFFDGAGLIGGEIDAVLGQAIRPFRDQVVLAGKVQIGPALGPLPVRASVRLGQAMGLVTSPAALRKRVEASLRSLATDCLDLLNLHVVVPGQCQAVRTRLIPALEELKQSGKVRAFGVTEAFARDPGHRALGDLLADGRIGAVMAGFHLANPSARARVFEPARGRGIAGIAMFAVNRAFRDCGGLQAALAAAGGRATPDEVLETLQAHGISGIVEAAYRFARHASGADLVLTGTANPAHLRENVRWLGAGPLPDPLVKKVAAWFGYGDSAAYAAAGARA